MKTMEWTFQDRSNWRDGEWNTEPDKQQWEDPETGMACLMVRNSFGAWCGYVGVEEAHPLYKIDYSACPLGCEESYCEHSPESVFSVHGGITYSDLCWEEDKERGICHVPEPGEPDPLWWLGFDTAHFGDALPSKDLNLHSESEYRNRKYVELGCASLARQLSEYAKG